MLWSMESRRVGHNLTTKQQNNKNKTKPEHSLEAEVAKLRQACFGHILRRQDSLEKATMLEKEEDPIRDGLSP